MKLMTTITGATLQPLVWFKIMQNVPVSKETRLKPFHQRLNQAETFLFLFKPINGEKKGDNKNDILDSRVTTAVKL